MINKKLKRKGTTTNHQDCIKQMDTLYTKIEETEGDYNNLLLQNNTLKSIITDLELKNNELSSKQDEMEKILDKLEINDNFGGLLDFLKLLYENKDDFMDLINKKKNNIKIIDPIQFNVKSNNDYINLQKDNKNTPEINLGYKKQIDDIKVQNNKYKPINDIPTPSSSTENKKIEDTKKSILLLPENNNEIVYYRNIKNNYSYFKKNNKRYLRCCGFDYLDDEISNINSITCIKCYKTYNLSENLNKNNLYENHQKNSFFMDNNSFCKCC